MKDVSSTPLNHDHFSIQSTDALVFVFGIGQLRDLVMRMQEDVEKADQQVSSDCP